MDRLLLFGSALCVAVFLSAGASADKSFTDSIDVGGKASVWLPVFDQECVSGGGVRVCGDWDWVADSRGNLSGELCVTASGAVNATWCGPTTGTLRRKMGQRATRNSLKARVGGTVAGATFNVLATFHGSASPRGCFRRSQDGCFRGKLCLRLNAKIPGRRKPVHRGDCGRVRVIVPLEEGAWTLNADVADLDGTNFGGTGSVVLSGSKVTDAPFDYDAVGTDMPHARRRNRRGLNVGFTPSDAAGVGTWVDLKKVQVDEGTNTIMSARGAFKLIGQAGRFRVQH